MDEREVIMRELWRRLALVPTVKYTARNSKAEPDEANFPAIQFYELEDQVLPDSPQHFRGGLPAFKRKFRVAIESFISGTTEESATKELYVFIKSVKKEIYRGDGKMGLKIAVIEVSATRVLRPPVGGHGIGLGLFFDFVYVEDISKIFP